MKSSNNISLKRNYIYKLLYEVLILLTPFITTPYVSRVLGADGIGIYSYTQSYMMYFTMFAALGTAVYGTREIAQCRNDKYEYSKKFWEIELITVGTSLTALVCWLIFSRLMPSYLIYFLVLIPVLLATMFDISWFYTGHERIGYTVIWNSLCKIIGVICIFLFVKVKTDLYKYILINSLALMIGNVSMWVFLPGFLVAVDPRGFRFKKHLKETIIYFVPTIAISIYTVFDKTLIGIITKDSFENGYYEQATKIINMVKTAVFVSVNSVMGARISYLFALEKYDEIKARLNKSMDFILFLGYGAAFGISAISANFVPLFFGPGYEKVILLIILMSPLVIIIGISSCVGSQYYTPAGLRIQTTKYILVGALCNFIFNILLIPYLKSVGAVIGSIIAESVISYLYLRNSKHFMTARYIWHCSYKRLAAGLIMAAIVVLFGTMSDLRLIFTICIQIALGIAVYFVILLILKDEMLKHLLGILGDWSRSLKRKN